MDVSAGSVIHTIVLELFHFPVVQEENITIVMHA